MKPMKYYRLLTAGWCLFGAVIMAIGAGGSYYNPQMGLADPALPAVVSIAFVVTAIWALVKMR